MEVEVETLELPYKVTGQQAEESVHRPALQVDGSHNRRVVTHRGHMKNGNLSGMKGNVKTTPTNRDDRCGTTSLAPNTPWR